MRRPTEHCLMMSPALQKGLGRDMSHDFVIIEEVRNSGIHLMATISAGGFVHVWAA